MPPGKLVLLCLFAAGLTSHAQSPPPRDSVTSTPTPAPTGTGRISGRVVAAESGDPLRNARVVLSPATIEGPLVLTDGEGRFAFTALPAGTYSVSAAKSGYAGSASSVRNAAARRVLVHLDDGAASSGITVALVRGAAISGRILDELGDPLINTNVVIEALNDAAKRTPRDQWTAQTNDLGEYRIGSLPEGDYVVSITVPGPSQVVSQGFRNVAITSFNINNSGPRRIYFPNAASLPDAEVIALKPGVERPAVDLVGPGAARLPIDVVGTEDPAPIARDPSVRATGAIRGRILASPGTPLPGAEVRLTGDAIRQLPAVNTDPLGQYEFLNLPPGSYSVSARKRGYISREFGQLQASDSRERITLAADERRDRAEITLPRTSAIEGRLTDEYGDPVEGVTIRPLRIRFVSGRRRLVDVPSSGSSRTDDLGRYRVSGLQPGSYVVAAYVGQLVLGQTGAADIPGYATTYFPGTPNPTELALVPVPASQDVNSVDFALSRIATATVSGLALMSTGEPITGGIVLAASRRSGSVSTTPVGARIQPDGAFEFPNVPPGQYLIQAYRGRSKPHIEGEFAAVPVTVNGVNVRGLVVQTSPGSVISGRMTFDGAPAPASRNVDLSPVPTDVDLAPLDGNLARAEIRDDWTFEMSGISGPRRLQLLRAPRGWGLKRILANGIDVTDAPLLFGARNQSLADVEVVLTSNITEIAGTASDDRGRAAADARVVVFAADRDLWYERSRFVKIARADANGAFVLRDLPPGTYFVSAVDRRRASEENGEWLNPELLESLAPGAPSITLSEGQKMNVGVKLAAR